MRIFWVSPLWRREKCRINGADAHKLAIPSRSSLRARNEVFPKTVLENPNAGVAQLAEQLICNQQVVGSSPITGSTQQN